MQRCAFRLLSLKSTRRSFAAQPPSLTRHSVLRQLAAALLLPILPPFRSFTLLVPPSLPFLSQHANRGSHFHVSGAPVSVTAPCPPVSLETASLVWEAAGEAIGVQLSAAREV